HSPIVSACVAPGFEEVRLRKMPIGKLGGLVGVKAAVKALVCLEIGVHEVEVSRGAVCRVSVEHDQRLHFARIEIANQLAQRLEAIHGFYLEGLCVNDGFADVVEPIVDGVNESVDGGRLLVASDDDGSAE